MAVWLDKLIASRSVCRPSATACFRYFNLKLQGQSTSEVSDLFNEAICLRLCATRNLARLLNLMDNRIGVATTTLPRWDVMEDTKALYIIRNMSGLPNKDFVEVPSQMYPFRNGFGCILIEREIAKIWFRVGLEGLDPGSTYPGYFIRIFTPDTIYRPDRDMVEMDVKDEVLKIVIPKKKGKWTRNITMNAELYWPPK